MKTLLHATPFSKFALIGMLSIAGISAWTSSASAASVTQSTTISPTALDFTTDPVSFQKFNSSLGTLTSIEFVIDASVESQITLTNQAGSTKNFDLTFAGKLSLLDESGLLSFDIATPTTTQTVRLANNASNTYSKTSAGTATVVYDGSTGARTSYTSTGNALTSPSAVSSSLTLANFIGIGDFVLYFDATNFSGVQGPSNTSVSSGTAGATVELIYNYTAIPEPSTYVMTIAGLGVVVAARRLHRRAV